MSNITIDKIIKSAISGRPHNFFEWNQLSMDYFCAALKDIQTDPCKYDETTIDQMVGVTQDFVDWLVSLDPTHSIEDNDHVDIITIRQFLEKYSQ